MLVISSAGAVIGAAVGYALEGIGLAIVEFLAFALAGFLAFRFGPVLRPPPPETMYERAVETARRERALYDELEIDSARERERAMKAGKAVAVLLVAPMAGLLAIAPGLIAERSESAAVRTLGTAISVTLLAVLVGAVVAARRRTRR